MKVREIMRRFPQIARPDDSLAIAREMMLWGQHHHLPVLDGGELIGIISERDILAHQARLGESLASRPGDTVEMAMTRNPKTAHPEDSVIEAAARLAAERIGCLPVLEEGRLIGLITTTDVLVAEVRKAMATEGTPRVREVMTRDPETIRPDDRLLDAAARMQQHRIRHLPVVDGETRVLGMLSDRDVRTSIGDPSKTFEGNNPRPNIAVLRVSDAMSTPAITTTADASCAFAARSFLTHTAGALPVVEADDRLVGIVSYIDLLRVLAG